MAVTLRPIQMMGLAGAATAALAGIWLLRNFDPNAADSPFPACMFYAFTGYYCIGCGLTRALHALVHGNLVAAFSMNPLAMLMLPIMPLLVAHSRGWNARVLRPVMAVITGPKVWLVVLPVYWIARNLPWFPFTLLAPG